MKMIPYNSAAWGEYVIKNNNMGISFRRVEEEEMNVTKKQIEKFTDMVMDFAKKNGLTVDVAYDSSSIEDEAVVRFRKSYIQTYDYHVYWKEVRSLTDIATKIFTDISLRWGLGKANVPSNLTIKKVIFNHPATIVIWEDGTKTVVKCGDEDFFDHEKGLAMAIAKKALGNQGNYFEVFKKHITQDQMNHGIKDVANMYPKFTFPEINIDLDAFKKNVDKLIEAFKEEKNK